MMITAWAVSACSGSTLNPVHEGKYTFQGRVTSEESKPIPNAWVKVRGWETVTDNDGRWKQDQIVECGTMREHMESHDEADDLLISATGFEQHEERFFVKHPGWFKSCQAEQTFAFDTVLLRDASKSQPKPESSPIPWPKDQNSKKRPKGTYL